MTPESDGQLIANLVQSRKITAGILVHFFNIDLTIGFASQFIGYYFRWIRSIEVNKHAGHFIYPNQIKKRAEAAARTAFN